MEHCSHLALLERPILYNYASWVERHGKLVLSANHINKQQTSMNLVELQCIAIKNCKWL